MCLNEGVVQSTSPSTRQSAGAVRRKLESCAHQAVGEKTLIRKEGPQHGWLLRPHKMGLGRSMSLSAAY